jgi:hypothetical protein
MTYSRIPPTCSQWSPPKITGPIWTSQAQNSLHLMCGRSRTNISTLLTPIKTGGLDLPGSAAFWVFFLYLIWRVHFGFAFCCCCCCCFVFLFLTLLYISKSVSTLISMQQYSLCLAVSCLSVLINSCLDKFVDWPVAPKIPDSYPDKTKTIFKTAFCKCY